MVIVFIMVKKSWLFYLVAALAIMLFFTVSLGGCGGSSSSSHSYSSNSGNENNDNQNGSDEPSNTQDMEPAPTRQVWQQDTAISLSGAKAGFDFDKDGIMDFLNFKNVGQFHLSTNVNAAGLPRNASFRAASEAKISVPAMVWLEELRPKEENPNIFQVYLEQGKEYTFEFSRNLTDNIDSNFPDLEIFDPENAALPFYEATPLRPEITPIPSESPSLICYTIKPEVSGWYLVNVSSQKSSVENYLESEDLVAAAAEENVDSELLEIDKGCVIFVYQEFRNEDGEPGYFTRFKFSDMNGNTTDPLNIREIIQLRKLFLEANPEYIETVYGQNMADDEFGDSVSDANFVFNDASSDLYLHYLDEIQSQLGLVNASSVKAARTSANSSRARLAKMRLANLPEITDNDDVFDSADQALKDFYAQNLTSADEDSDELFGATDSSYSTEKVLVDNGSSNNTGDTYGASGSAERSTIQAAIAGLPFEATYRPGTTYSAITDMSSVGGVTAIGLEEMLEEARKNSTTSIPLKTNFWTELITTREESEKHSEVTVGGGVAVAKKAAGEANFSVGTTSNYKYGLTSTTLVIHFEVAETDYRLLPASKYNDFAMDNKLHKKAKKFTPDAFRKQYGDYFVAGYQYGACYEASIAITTDTMEQINEVKSTLKGKGTYNDVTVSVDMQQKMRETFNKNSARLSISVITTGLESDVPSTLPITHSTDIAGIEQVFAEYTKFRAQILENVKANKRESFVPLRAYWMRWRSLPCIADQVLDNWGPVYERDRTGKSVEIVSGEPGWDGTLPITPDQFGKAQEMHSALVDLRAYYNASAQVRGVLPSYIATPLNTSFDKIIGTITAKGEDFYINGDASGDIITVYLPLIIDLSDRCKDWTDRYVFYNKLIEAQKLEKAVTADLQSKLSAWKADDDGSDDRLKIVNQCPFGADGGGHSGFKSFPLSKTVTQDYAACEENPKKKFDEDFDPWYCHKRYYYDSRQGGTSRLEWWYGQRADSKGSSDWQKNVGDAYIEATAKDGSNAVFTYVQVSSTATKSYEDRRRFLNPIDKAAVGSRGVGFRFMSSYGNSVSWIIEGTPVRLRAEDYPFEGLEQ